jgi:leader peptidase (prepilin peptidase)/N-methyltransferase
VISWLALRGRCAACKAPISVRYPAGGARHRPPVGLGRLAFRLRGAAAACALLVTWALIALTGIDIDHQLLPDSITLPLLWAGLLAAVVIGPAPGARCRCRRKMPIIGAPRAT